MYLLNSFDTDLSYNIYFVKIIDQFTDRPKLGKSCFFLLQRLPLHLDKVYFYSYSEKRYGNRITFEN